MDTGPHDGRRRLLEDVVVPVADAEDARRTARALRPYETGTVTALYVVEKAGGAPDKTPVEQSENIAAEAFEAFREKFPDAGTEIVYDESVVEGILDAAEDLDATAVAFQPREGSRVVQFLSGDRTLRLVTEASVPVVSLPAGDGDA